MIGVSWLLAGITIGCFLSMVYLSHAIQMRADEVLSRINLLSIDVLENRRIVQVSQELDRAVDQAIRYRECQSRPFSRPAR